jgi:hypothetical protein
MDWSKTKKADVLNQGVVNCFHAPAHEVDFVPEASSTRIPQELLPTHPVGFKARPGFKRLEVTPILSHP